MLLEELQYAARNLMYAALQSGVRVHPEFHDIGEQDGRSFIVMEYLEGMTLKDRLAAGSMSLNHNRLSHLGPVACRGTAA